MLVQRINACDVFGRLPETSRLSGWALARDAVIICAAGFEDRSPAIVQRLSAEGGLRNTKLLLIRYPTNRSDNALREPAFTEAAKSSAGIEWLEYRRATFAEDLKARLDCLLSTGGRAVIDVSTMSSYIFYPVFFSLLDRDVELTVVYSEADQYYPLKEEWEAVAGRARAETELFVSAFENASFQSCGLDEVYAFAPYYEYSFGSRPTTLVCVPNFSVLRLRAMTGKATELYGVGRDMVHWVIGRPPSADKEWRMEAVRETNGLAKVPVGRLYEASTLQYKEVAEVLDRIWDSTKYDSTLSIACLGSKMQHLGVALFCRIHKEVSLWLSEPQQFSGQRFSMGRGDCWQLDLGPTTSLRQTLDSQGTYTWQLPGN